MKWHILVIEIIEIKQEDLSNEEWKNQGRLFFIKI